MGKIKGWTKIFDKQGIEVYRSINADPFFPQVNIFVTNLDKNTYEVHYVTRKNIKVLIKNVNRIKAKEIAIKFMRGHPNG